MRGNIGSRLIPIALMTVALMLGACGAAATPSPSPSPIPTPTPTVAPAPPSVEPAATPEPTASVTIYVVRSGDTLIGIAKKFKITLKALRAANPQVTDPTKMQIGEKLVIPAQ